MEQAARKENMFEYVHHVAYVVSDMEDALRIFRDTFELELSDRRVMDGETSVEMAAFRCGPTLIEVLRPIHHPLLEQFLKEHGPGLHHVGFAMKDIARRAEELNDKGVFINGPFTAGTGWKIAYFDFEKSDLGLFNTSYHGDHLAEAG
jgi:methylmalonyl-CoA/ethylmalonyl-CoA epimerase